LRIKAQLDSGTYPTGIKVSDEQLATVNLKPAKFHGEWNYCAHPQQKK
ncbi:MAG: ISAzo13 family transposase, partial [Phycisphaerales bacterium]|nr:ISAzo13 family transposase [Phycisphaerales bacterium]